MSKTFNNNMVESEKIEETTEDLKRAIEELIISRSYMVTRKDIDFDICRLEKFTKNFSNLNEEIKKDLLEKNLEKEIQKMIYEEEINTEKLSYSELRTLLTERYRKPELSLTEYFRTKQQPSEGIEEYLRKMERAGKRLKLTGKVRLEVIWLGITRHTKVNFQALIKEKTITEGVIETLKAIEELEIKFHSKTETEKRHENGKDTLKKDTGIAVKNKRSYVCFRCEKPGHIAKYCRSGAIKDKSIIRIEKKMEFLNKDSSIYVYDKKLNPIFDTGAVENYISHIMLRYLEITATRTKHPYIRYTCLGEPFKITEEVDIRFCYQGKYYTEWFYVLPKRKDQMVLLGKKWIMAATNQLKDVNIPKEESKEELIEKLFLRSPSGIKLDYNCTINYKGKEIISEGTPTVPHAIEDKMDDTVKILLEHGYIRISRSPWCSRIRPVEKEDGTIRLTTNLIKLNKYVPLDRYSLPKTDEILRFLSGKSYFSKIDLKDGFFQIPLKESDRHMTAFKVKNRLYEWNRMPMGFINVPAVFQD